MYFTKAASACKLFGFFAASLIASFIFLPRVGAESVSGINSVLDQYKNWAFVLAFTSIGLDTNFREIKEQFRGGKPLTLYVEILHKSKWN